MHLLLDDGTRVSCPSAVARSSGFQQLRSGQRVAIDEDEGRVTSIRWWARLDAK
jgi:hypothetical protein